MKQRLQKCLAEATGISRRKAEEAIAAGRVRVNGEVVSNQGVQASLETDRIELDGVVLRAGEKKIHLAFHKPRQVMTTRFDPEGRPTVMDYVADHPARAHLFPVGRLDFDSEGLLFLTNDGAWANALSHPRYEVEKEYEVLTESPIGPRDARALEEGVTLSDGPGRFLSIRPLPAAPSGHSRYAVVVGEGRNRFIRRMFEAIGNSVHRLMRVRVGGFWIGGLPPGKLQELTPEEVRRLLPTVAAEGSSSSDR